MSRAIAIVDAILALILGALAIVGCGFGVVWALGIVARMAKP